MSPWILLVLLAAADEPATLVARDFAFEPVDLEVAAGAEVTFRNDGQAPHTATGRNDSFNVEAASGRSAAFRAPLELGRYEFVCAYHDEMRGHLTVVEATETAPNPGDADSTPGFGALGLVAALLFLVLRRRRGVSAERY